MSILNLFRKFFDSKILLSDDESVLEAVVRHNKQHATIKDITDLLFYSNSFYQIPMHHLICNVVHFTRSIRRADAVLVWGAGEGNRKLVSLAMKYGKPVVLAEDGLIRSLFNWAADVPFQYKQGMSFTFDAKAFYFCGGYETDIENLLNSYVVSQENIAYAKQLIFKIVENKISKYNFQPSCDVSELDLRGPGHGDVLVIV